MDNSYCESLDFSKSILDCDINLQLSYKMFRKHILEDIRNGINSNNEYKNYISINTESIKNFIDELYISHDNILTKFDVLVKEIFIIHQICRCFYYYNKTELQLSHQEFRSKIFFPNLIYSLIRFFSKANYFFRDIISSVYFEISKKSYGIIKKFSNASNLDHDIIKADILCEFIGNSIKKFNPLKIDKIYNFYKQVFRNIFYYYFKKSQPDISYHTILNLESSGEELFYLNNNSTRISVYRKILYNIQIEKYCSESNLFDQLNYNYNIFKNVIVNNELQNIYFNSQNSLYYNNKLRLMKIYDYDKKMSNKTLNEIMELPLIYKLLKCVHIISNNKTKPYNEKIIKPQTVKNAILEELMIPFNDIFSGEQIYNILEKISKNFTTNILNGEYLNLVTLNVVKIDQISFITQLRRFVKICLSNED